MSDRNREPFFRRDCAFVDSSALPSAGQLAGRVGFRIAPKTTLQEQCGNAPCTRLHVPRESYEQHLAPFGSGADHMHATSFLPPRVLYTPWAFVMVRRKGVRGGVGRPTQATRGGAFPHIHTYGRGLCGD